ncbi:hypothetical protein Pla163_17470 [Planctomycetes bacterium Pla163]|uniref:PQQ enzyme repeat protein n=1 Tax=Rohdeia mirabilis TaxID=2528008 RepID=A0A518CZH7_9BACT|nr:hypothetical protein Pla163_17470 [Planctomycetes bacterium Pla163]
MLVVAACSALLAGGAALAPTTPSAVVQIEGSLGNATRVPVDETATRALAAADEILAAVRESDGDTRPIGAFFDALLAAVGPGPHVAASAERRPVPAAAPPGTALEPDRIFEDPACAFARRIAWLDADERSAWRAHTRALGERALARAGADPVRLAGIERHLPGTEFALVATLRLVDLETASGRAARASGWLRRAGEGLVLLEDDAQLAAPFAAAIERRAAALDALIAAARSSPARRPSDAASTWNAVESTGAVLITDSLGPSSRAAGLDPGVGLFNGLVALDDGRWCVQSAGRVHLVDVDVPRVVGRFEPALLLEPTIGSPPFPYPTSEAPGWHLVPATDGRDLLLVEGRSRGRASGSNALLRVAPPPRERAVTGTTPEEALLARAVWARSAGGHARVDGTVVPLEELAGVEFQPGPLVLGGDTCVVSRRRGVGEVEAGIDVLEWRTGDVRAQRVLAVGRELEPEDARPGAAVGRSANSPLSADGTRVLLSTNLGLVALVDSLDGRLIWALRTQRRAYDSDARGRGWTGIRAVHDGSHWYCAPADSDHLYTLPQGPWIAELVGPALGARASGGSGVALIAPPLERGDALFLGAVLARGTGPVGGSEARLVAAVRAGPRQSLALVDPARAETRPGVYLPLGEALCEGIAGLAGGRRILAAGERHLYLFDGSRELFLLHQDAFEDPRAPRPRGRTPALGGSVHVVGDRIGVLSADALLLFGPTGAGEGPR